MTEVRVRLLGGFAVTIDGVPVLDQLWARRQAATLVKVLALSPRARLHREQLIDRIWPGLDPDQAGPRLHKASYFARRALGEGSVVLTGEIVSLFPESPPSVDAHEFARAAAAAVESSDPELAARAADLYPGELLPDDRYAEWADAERERLRLLHLEVLRDSGRWEALLAADPTDEEAHLTLVRRLVRAGDRSGALRQFERLERALRVELGVGLSRDALRLREDVLAMPSPIPAAAEQRTPRARTVLGRDAELARTRSLLDRVLTGQGRMLFVAGPQGIGKSTILVELEEQATTSGMRVGTASAAVTDSAWPFAPVLEALADLSRRHPVLLDGLADGLREEIERALAGRGAPWLGESTHQRLFVAAAELLRLAATGPGALLVVDDAGLADESSLKLLHYLARATATEKVLIALGHRSQPGPALARLRDALLGRASAITMDVGPLPLPEAAALVRLSLPTADDELIGAWHAVTAGSPFELAELARAVARGEPVSPPALLPSDAPQDMVRALAEAALLGARFDTDEFQALTGLADAPAFEIIEQGLAHRVLLRTPGGLAFRHKLLRDALLSRLHPGERREIHTRAARALESLGGPASRIGRHFVEAGDYDSAIPWVLRAAETNASLGAYSSALAGLSSVQDHATGEDHVRLLCLRADLLLAMADRGAQDAYREALAVARDETERSHLRVGLARAAMFEGDFETAEIALDGLELKGSTGDSELMLARGNFAYLRGDMDAAQAIATEARRRIALGSAGSLQVLDLVGLQGLLAHQRGEWFQHLQVELRKAVDNPGAASGIFDGHLCVAEYILNGTTPHQDVLDLAARLRESAERAGVLRAVAFATALRGEAALLMGDLDLAECELQESGDLHHDLGSLAGEAHALQRLADVHLTRGDRAEATRLANRALPLARWSPMARHLIQRVYGTLIYAAPTPDAARAVVDRAEATMGVDDECVFCKIMFVVPAGHACADVGDVDRARAYFTDSQTVAGRWEGTSWQAMVLELQAHLEHVEGRKEVAAQLLSRAAELFEAAGHQIDAQRCRRGGRINMAASPPASARATG